VELKDRVKALRKSLNLTQEVLAERGGLERVEVSNLESGRNQATSVRILRGLAKGFGLELQDALDFVDGTLSVDAAAAKTVRAGREARSARELAAELAREIGVSERAVAAVLAEPVTAEREAWPALWWADAMRRRELDLLSGAAPTPGAKASDSAAAAPGSRRRG
jgi:DNA-binding XRE family transcriptional regulator